MINKMMQRVAAVFFACIIGVFCPQYSFALQNFQEEYLDMFSQNNILFYDPEGDNCINTAISSKGDSDGSDVFLVGDSISVYSANAIKNLMPKIEIDAVSGTYFSKPDGGVSGVERVRTHIGEIAQRGILVFAMGTNGGIDQNDINELFGAISGQDVKVILMTIYYSDDWANEQESSSNNVVKAAAEQYSNVSYMDWYSVATELNDDARYFENDGIHAHPTPDGQDIFAKTMKDAVDDVSIVGSSSISGSGDYSAVYTAKNADQYVFNVPGSSEWSAEWGDGNTESMAKVLDHYGDLAYQLGRAAGVPWIAIIVQMRYEDPNSVCGANNFWGNGCPPGTGAGGASIQGSNLGDGFAQYGATLTNGYHNQALGIEDPKEYLEKIGPTWVQGNINGPGYGSIEGMKKSVDALQDFVQTSEGQAIVSQFGSYTGTFAGRQFCADSGGDYAGNGVTVTDYNGNTIAFPIAYATKGNISGGRGTYKFLSNIPCNNSVGCHYGEGAPAGQAAAAFDICFDESNDPSKSCVGATVVSITSGTITRSITTTRNGASCNHVRVLSDYNNKTIAYMHLEYDDTLASTLTAGTHIEAGTVIGRVSGNGPCHDDSTPHVHIDMNSVVGQPGGASNSMRDSEIVALINAAYSALPENDEELAAREAANVSGASNRPIEPLGESSANVACDPRTRDLGVYNGYVRGSTMQVRLCAVDSIKSTGLESNGYYGIEGGNGAIIVNSRVSGAFAALGERAKEDGVALSASSSFRSNEHQQSLFSQNGCVSLGGCSYSCSGTETAVPGCSNHQAGYAVDFNVGGSWSSAVSVWLGQNIGEFGLSRTVSSEPWHVSPGG